MFSFQTTTKKATPPAASLKDDQDEQYQNNQRDRRRYELKGYERSFSISPSGCTRLAHIMNLSISSSTHQMLLMPLILRYMTQAFQTVMQQHPKMRALVVSKEDPLVAEIVPALEVTTDVVSRLVTIKEPFSSNQKEEERVEEIQQLVQEICNQPVDRTTQFPFFLIVKHDELDETEESSSSSSSSRNNYTNCTLMLFSDHVFSDATSGMVVLHDLLVHLSTLIEHDNHEETQQQQQQQVLLPNEFPLRPPLYDLLRPPPTMWQRGADAMITSFGENFLISSIANFLPVLAPRQGDDMQDVNGLPLPNNPSYCYMHVNHINNKNNNNSNLVAMAKIKCANEQVSLTSAITASLVLAYSKMVGAPYAFSTTPTPKFLLGLDLQYHDIMSRRSASNPEAPVGCNIFCAAQDVVSETGLELHKLSFWKAARMAETCATSTVSSWNAMAEYIYTHHKFHASVPELKLKAQQGIISDVSLSHVEYPYPTEHSVRWNSTSTAAADDGDGTTETIGTLNVQGLQVYHSMPNVSYCAVVFITVVKDTFHYTLMSKLSNDNSKQLLQYIVKAVEGIVDMTNDETMLQAVQRVYGEE